MLTNNFINQTRKKSNQTMQKPLMTTYINVVEIINELFCPTNFNAQQYYKKYQYLHLYKTFYLTQIARSNMCAVFLSPNTIF